MVSIRVRRMKRFHRVSGIVAVVMSIRPSCFHKFPDWLGLSPFPFLLFSVSRRVAFAVRSFRLRFVLSFRFGSSFLVLPMVLGSC